MQPDGTVAILLDQQLIEILLRIATDFEEIEVVCQKLENGPVGFENP